MKKNQTPDYRDQAGSSVVYGDRRITSFYTPYGIQCIDSNFIARIQNINVKVKSLHQIDRVKEILLDRKGEKYESLNYKTVYPKIPLTNNPQQGCCGLRVVWENGAVRDFTNGDNFPKIFIDGKESASELKKDIKTNPHLHKEIKKNLLFNLKTYCS